MKQKLLERMQQMNAAIEQHKVRLDQAQAVAQQCNADLNMLRGCQQELAHIISLYDALPEAPKEETSAAIVEEPAVMGEAV